MDIYGNKLVNTIETKPLCISLSNLADILTMVGLWRPIEFVGQRSKVKVTMDTYGNKLVNTLETKSLCASRSNLADLLTMVRGWTLLNNVDFGGQRSRSQLTNMIYGNKLVNTIATKPLCAYTSNLADMLTMVRG